MFTGLVRAVGVLAVVERHGAGRLGGGARFLVECAEIAPLLSVGDSVSLNGVCLTCTETAANRFGVEAVDETLRKTTLGRLKKGERVNLEPAMTASDALGGHIVLGHVDAAGRILSITEEAVDRLIRIKYPREFERYIVPTGSVAVDGISLTVARVRDGEFSVAIIPHTWTHTILSDRKAGDEVNIEFDVIGKYVVRMLELGFRPKSGSLSEDNLRSLGY